LGKTECFTVDWLWGIYQDRSNTPSRLVISLPMRTLTHQTFDRVGKILQRLQLDTEVSLHKLVGGTGETMDRSWCNYIDRPSIIIGTQDQILSRQLFKGYATNRWEWSVHAALLNVADCAQWHDLGKAHPQFQNTIVVERRASSDNSQDIWAKAPSMSHYQRRGFRHELASAIGALIHGKSFLFAYIVAAHHGKVRVRIDNFYWLKDEKGLRGLIVGDRVPPCSLGNDASDAEVKIDEFSIDLPESGEWKIHVEKEIENLGVFKLSYLETLVRIADRRASALREIDRSP
jgi:hypothetical protein